MPPRKLAAVKKSPVEEILESPELRENLLEQLREKYLGAEGTSIAEIVPAPGFIIWTPNSDLPPRRVFETEEEAFKVAFHMAERYRQTFNVCKIVGLAEPYQAPTVVKRFG